MMIKKDRLPLQTIAFSDEQAVCYQELVAGNAAPLKNDAFAEKLLHEFQNGRSHGLAPVLYDNFTCCDGELLDRILFLLATIYNGCPLLAKDSLNGTLLLLVWLEGQNSYHPTLVLVVRAVITQLPLLLEMGNNELVERVLSLTSQKRYQGVNPREKKAYQDAYDELDKKWLLQKIWSKFTWNQSKEYLPILHNFGYDAQFFLLNQYQYCNSEEKQKILEGMICSFPDRSQRCFTEYILQNKFHISLPALQLVSVIGGKEPWQAVILMLDGNELSPAIWQCFFNKLPPEYLEPLLTNFYRFSLSQQRNILKFLLAEPRFAEHNLELLLFFEKNFKKISDDETVLALFLPLLQKRKNTKSLQLLEQCYRVAKSPLFRQRLQKYIVEMRPALRHDRHIYQHVTAALAVDPRQAFALQKQARDIEERLRRKSSGKKSGSFVEQLYRRTIDAIDAEDYGLAEIFCKRLVEIDPNGFSSYAKLSRRVRRYLDGLLPQQEQLEAFFPEITRKEKEILWESCQLQYYQAGDNIILAGECFDYIYIILDKGVQVYGSSVHPSCFLRKSEPGEIYGIELCNNPSYWTFSLAACRNLFLVTIECRVLQTLQSKEPNLFQAISGQAEKKLPLKETLQMIGNERRKQQRHFFQQPLRAQLRWRGQKIEFTGESLDISQGGIAFFIRGKFENSVDTLRGKVIVLAIRGVEQSLPGHIMAIRQLTDEKYCFHVCFMQPLKSSALLALLK